MIVVIGNPEPRATPHGTVPGGLAATVALAAAAAGGVTQLLARVPDDPDGDTMLLALTAGHVGHVATLRQPAGPQPPILQAADLQLGLRYLADVSVLVLADATDPDIRRVVADAAAWSRAPLIAIVTHGAPVPADLPPEATVLEAPSSDPDGAFAAVVGGFAAALSRGDDAGAAFRATVAGAGGWSAVDDRG